MRRAKLRKGQLVTAAACLECRKRKTKVRVHFSVSFLILGPYRSLALWHLTRMGIVFRRTSSVRFLHP